MDIGGVTLMEDKTPRYLGVVLDRKLTLLGHIQDLARKASSKLNLVKRLASTKWGANANILKTLYTGASDPHWTIACQCNATRPRRP